MLQTENPQTIHKGFAILLSGGAIFAGFLLASILLFQILFSNRVYPGVSISGIDIGGLSANQLEPFIKENFEYPTEGKITLKDNGHSWTVSPKDLGLLINSIGSAKYALQIGREGNIFNRISTQYLLLQSGQDIPIMLVLDETTTQRKLSQIADSINQPSIEAELTLDGMEVNSSNGQIGRIVDIPSLISQIEEHFNSLTDATFTLPIVESNPLIFSSVEEAVILQSLLSQSVFLKIDNPLDNDPGPWEIPPEALAEMVQIQQLSKEGQYQFDISLAPNKLIEILTPIEPGLIKFGENARFIFNDETELLEVIQPAVIGRKLLIIDSIIDINKRIMEGENNINLVFEFSPPDITDTIDGDEFGITELVSAQTTYFYGSSAGRIQNIQTAAAQFHGIMIAPGATFSMVEYLGDISLNTGYAEALIIYGDRTIKGVGGGVCQVSTTLFRTVFFGGFPVDTRYSHSYRVYYYELAAYGGVNTQMAGLDATVYTPIVDFQFTNDSPHWLLMETYVSPGARSITWKFYSTSDGRTVSWDTTGLQNKVEPPEPIYEENPDLAKGEVDQVDWAVEGADVTVSRTVYIEGEVHFSDQFITHYSPWGDVYQYGPGTKGYPPKDSTD